MNATSAPLVSVIVPNHRHAAFLRERLDSVLGQSVSDLEVILLDDASGDGSVELLRNVAERDARVAHVVVNSTNSGSPFSQWRKGIALARGRWVWIAESDDSCSADLLERLLRVAEAAPAAGLLYAQSTVVDDQGNARGTYQLPGNTPDPVVFSKDFVMDGAAFVRDLLAVRNVIPNASAVIFRRDLVQDATLWEGTESMRLCGDWLFWSRLARGTAVGFVAEPLNRFRLHAAASRVHRTLERKRLRLVEEARVRNELATVPHVDQHRAETALYRAWGVLFAVRAFTTPAFDAVRLKGRSRARFIMTCLRAKWDARSDHGRRMARR
jgi:glycosyltransferase involved in cell wall biosynthesis